jgi:viroplasmin and RNaseH domain-containing protein
LKSHKSEPVCTVGTLGPNECITAGNCLQSDNGEFKVYMQENGDLRLLKTSDNSQIWNLKPTYSESVKACLKDDGNFVTYKSDGSESWATNRFKNDILATVYLKVENDGRFRINKTFFGFENILWDSLTDSK